MMLIVLLFASALCEILASQEKIEDEVITTKSGKIRGIIQSSSLSGITVQTFFNIPYAEAPVGRLRFEKPQPRKPWNETLNSTEEKIACLQPTPYEPGVTVTEDCLILNVWTPHPLHQNTSVMVWIHGGAFRQGHSGQYPGSSIVAVGGVIVVTINYRLSALGFLTTGDERIKGNLGLYDQRLAMKWVKDNIASFGGNPNSITIFGESAGGSSVSAHTISKESWSYFGRAILQSGSMLMPWGVMTDSEIKNGVKWFLRNVNCKNDEKLLGCLRNVTTEAMKKVLNSEEGLTTWIGPTVDREFISDHPQKLWRKGEVKNQNLILGITKDEMFLYNYKLLKDSRNVSDYLKHFEELLKNHFKNSSKLVYDKARELYKPECIPSYIEALKPGVAFESDRLFICATRYEANLRSKIMNTTNVYLYQYSHAPLVPYAPILYPYGTLGYAAHGLDLLSVFGLPINDTKFLPEDQILSVRMILYWTNFAKTGNPNSGTRQLPLVLDNVDTLPTWPQHSSSTEEYLDMGSLSQMVVRTKLREKYCEFLLDPEGFIEREVKTTSYPGPSKNSSGVKSCSPSFLLALQAWIAVIGIYVNFT